ncbi:efflux RND transporter periplasmic adaptor subunit [Roseovarius salis]|uniref:efflux RND transporter periplasmic adaptor subunit n=1 Tax=Roseovarius salis TaxID=3376063 RepID=UPI0037CA3D39
MPLEFEDDPGATRSAWIALGLVLLVAGWFASGMLTGNGEAALPSADDGNDPVQVAVAESVARTVADVLVAEGQAMPDRETEVLAEASGKVIEVPAPKGAMLGAGDVIAQLDPTEREADLRRAETEVERTRREYRNAQTLLERGISTLDRVADTRAALAAAEAQLAAARESLSDATIRAPFAGRLEELPVNPGEFVAAGAPVARIVDNQPLTVRARIAQQSVARISTGQSADVGFITGERRTGKVVFVGANADARTRTFLMEVEVPNEGGKIPSGVSAEIRIETGQTRAHFVSPALLALDERGALGLKTVDDDNRVGFYEVDVVRAGTDGVWVTGLPERVRLITVGQGFVRSGEQVEPRPDDRALPAIGDGPQ